MDTNPENNRPEGTEGQTPPNLPPHVPFYAPPTAILPQRRVYTTAEKWLLLAALCAGILYDRLVVANYLGMVGEWLDWSGWAIFWLSMTAAFCVLNWDKLRRNAVGCLVGGLCVALGVWFLFGDVTSNWEYAALSFLVFPVSLMGFAQFIWGGFALKEAGGLALAWLMGFFVRPFSALRHCFGALGALVRPKGKGRAVKILVGCVLSFGILLWLFSSMSQADLVFQHYVSQIFREFQIEQFLVHAIWVLIVALLMYSFFWNTRWAERKKVGLGTMRLDPTVATIVLVSVLAAYALFSVVQFTFLFGRAGLPEGLTYSRYAVSGFWQVVYMALFNLALFGVVLRCVEPSPRFRALAGGLLLATGVMLTSAAVRLSMYIAVYNMTWLRLISAWFLIYLAAVLVLCAVRLFYERLPLIAMTAILLLGWYAALGYANPAGLIAWFAR